ALGWAGGASAEIGMPVFALANPGGRGLRATFGFVSGIERTFRGPRGHRITGSLEHTAPLLPGSSGGPVLNAGGQLLGINTNRPGEGFYPAIPADGALRGRADALARGESAASPRLGVAIAPGHVARRLRRAVGLPDTEGVLIRDVAEDSPAARAGLAQGDLIVAAAGQPVRTADDLFDALQAAQGGAIELKLVRGTEERTLQVALGGGGRGGRAGRGARARRRRARGGARRPAAASGAMSLANAPMPDSDPARYFSLPGARLTVNSSRCRAKSPPPRRTGAWCQAEMYGAGRPKSRSNRRSRSR